MTLPRYPDAQEVAKLLECGQSPAALGSPLASARTQNFAKFILMLTRTRFHFPFLCPVQTSMLDVGRSMFASPHLHSPTPSRIVSMVPSTPDNSDESIVIQGA